MKTVVRSGGIIFVKYLIDHTTKKVHRTSQIGDACNVHTSVSNEREVTENLTKVNEFIEKKTIRALRKMPYAVVIGKG